MRWTLSMDVVVLYSEATYQLCKSSLIGRCFFCMPLFGHVLLVAPWAHFCPFQLSLLSICTSIPMNYVVQLFSGGMNGFSKRQSGAFFGFYATISLLILIFHSFQAGANHICMRSLPVCSDHQEVFDCSVYSLLGHVTIPQGYGRADYST